MSEEAAGHYVLHGSFPSSYRCAGILTFDTLQSSELMVWRGIQSFTAKCQTSISKWNVVESARKRRILKRLHRLHGMSRWRCEYTIYFYILDCLTGCVALWRIHLQSCTYDSTTSPFGCRILASDTSISQPLNCRASVLMAKVICNYSASFIQANTRWQCNYP